jgi:hypothetical protein
MAPADRRTARYLLAVPARWALLHELPVTFAGPICGQSWPGEMP